MNGDLKIALAGNPNSGKSTLFNLLTGSNQYVGNWPGVTVEYKEGKLRSDKTIKIIDLPGIYSLSPYTMEEVVSRDYLLDNGPDVVIDVIDATNIERNLYLATQLAELNIPLVLALNKMDDVKKNGDSIDSGRLESLLGARVVEISAIRNENIDQLIKEAVLAAESKSSTIMEDIYDPNIEKHIREIENIEVLKDNPLNRFYATKLLENDPNILESLDISSEDQVLINSKREILEEELDSDIESIVIDERYDYVTKITSLTVKKGRVGLTRSDKIDRVLTSKYLGIPIFAAIMFLVYYISITVVGGDFTDWFNDEFLMGTIAGTIRDQLLGFGVAPWLVSLIYDGIFGGVFAVIGFLPIIATLFFFIAILEDIGYMSRIAFILDKLLRKFGLSGKSFIPILIGTGCSVPGIIATRTIESDSSRRMTIVASSFMPCGAKTDIIAMFAAVLGGRFWFGPLWYFGGIIAVIITGLILKKTRLFVGDPAPFVMELPEYHMPYMKNVLKVTWDRCKDFVQKAGTVILVAMVLIWVLEHISTDFRFIPEYTAESQSILSFVGKKIAPIFSPLGFGNWIAAVATFLGLIAKEIVVGTFGVLSGLGEVGADNPGLAEFITQNFTTLQIISFMFFNQLTVPCFAAVGAIRQEMKSTKYFWFAIVYQLIFSYTITLMIYQFGLYFSTRVFTMWTGISVAVLLGYIYLIFRPERRNV